MHKATATNSTLAIWDATAPKRTFSDAYALARPLAVSGNREGATLLLCRLLWHVEGRDGGFIGLSDAQLRDKCATDKRLSYAAAVAAANAPGSWGVIQPAHTAGGR